MPLWLLCFLSLCAALLLLLLSWLPWYNVVLLLVGSSLCTMLLLLLSRARACSVHGGNALQLHQGLL